MLYVLRTVVQSRSCQQGQQGVDSRLRNAGAWCVPERIPEEGAVDGASLDLSICISASERVHTTFSPGRDERGSMIRDPELSVRDKCSWHCMRSSGELKQHNRTSCLDP